MVGDDVLPVFSMEELDGELKRGGVSRGLRRRVVSDARAMRALLLVDGVAADRVRFRAVVCDCCGVLEVTAFGADGAPRRMH